MHIRSAGPTMYPLNAPASSSMYGIFSYYYYFMTACTLLARENIGECARTIVLQARRSETTESAKTQTENKEKKISSFRPRVPSYISYPATPSASSRAKTTKIPNLKFRLFPERQPNWETNH
jgi:hypothetical protein